MTLTRETRSVRPVFVEPLPPRRLLALDVFRGMVIVAMLLVNNIGDPAAVGYFWKHANWIEGSQAQAYHAWWQARPAADHPGGFVSWAGQVPLLRHCTLADYVMPWFILIIGVAIPFAVSARQARGEPPLRTWLHVLRRSLTLVVLGWAIGISLTILRWRYSTEPDARLQLTLGMDVLQLLGLSYLVARILYILPLAPRIGLAMLMLVAHWAVLRFYPQGELPAGTFTQEHEAIGYIYRTWPVFQPITLVPGRLNLSMIGMLSVIPAAGTMLLGTWIGQWLRRDDLRPRVKFGGLMVAGAACAAVGFLWAFDLPFNKPRWTPAYLLWCSGIGAVLLGCIYWAADVRQSDWWTRFFVVFGLNSIAVYWLSIMIKIWTINMIKVDAPGGGSMMLTTKIVQSLQHALHSAAAGSWAFTLLFVAFWWLVLELAYRRRIFWKL